MEVQPKYRDAARKDDIIYHEYVHAVVYQLGLNYDTPETKARNEAYADYFSCSYTNDPIFGEWFAYEEPYMRNLSNSATYYNYKNFDNIHYQDNYNNIDHRNGMIWSGACWDLRNTLSQTLADELIFNGLYLYSLSYDFDEALEGIVAYDYIKYYGVHEQTIKSIFQARGIGNPSDCLITSEFETEHLFIVNLAAFKI